MQNSIPDYQAFIVDTSDGIPCIPKWGAKSSSTLLARYHYIEQIPSDYRLWDVTVRSAAALGLSLEEHRKDVALYKKLATLRLDVPIVETVLDLEWKGAHKVLFSQLCKETGMENLSTQPDKWIPEEIQVIHPVTEYEDQEWEVAGTPGGTRTRAPGSGGQCSIR